ncbi:MAG: hypothetical protein HQM16_15990 [Deltaproteobacteria bacterium]|nr:hypothetical protein [Deltaproteobacteria bacterium]
MIIDPQTITPERSLGVQVGGLINKIMGDFTGLQVVPTGLWQEVRGDFKGLMYGGLLQSAGQFKGVMIGGLMHLVGREVKLPLVYFDVG